MNTDSATRTEFVAGRGVQYEEMCKFAISVTYSGYTLSTTVSTSAPMVHVMQLVNKLANAGIISAYNLDFSDIVIKIRRVN